MKCLGCLTLSSNHLTLVTLRISQQLNDSLKEFSEHNFEESLSKIIPAYLFLGEILGNITFLSDYYEPTINFYTINETVMDYGDNFSISGKLISYEKPNVTISSNNYTRHCEINVLFSEEYLYETEFSIEASSILFGTPEGNSIFDVVVFDGVVYFHHSIVICFQTLGIKIISPTNGMILDLSLADSFTILCFYHSVSNTSTLQILYGGYWFVRDHEGNQSFWTDLTKDTSNEWSLDVNSSSFINGVNLVIVRITNGVSFREDRIQLEISGLPKPSNWSGEVTSATPSDSNFSPTKEEISPLIEFIQQSWFLFLCIGGVFSIIVLRDIRQWYIQNQSMKTIPSKAQEPSKHLKDLVKTINQKDPLSDTIDNQKKISFKPKRRK